MDTGEFPLKLLTHSLIEENKSSSLVNDDKGLFRSDTPRFPNEEEIEFEERRLLLSFAFKDQIEIDRYRKEMQHLIS